jgi:quinoprotein glucose dehydrogenase
MPGEFGNETWEDGSWEWSGNVGVWTEMSADPELGLVYLPIETPTIDVYGGNRPGDNLFSESVVAVDLKTGERKWHFQMVHHPLWDYDAVGAPLLIDATIDGQARKLVCQPSKQGWLYTFDRITGEPIWPMPERQVPQSTVPGEKSAPTQPFPSKPPLYSRNYLAEDGVIDYTPELHRQALENLKQYQWEQTPFVPYVIPTDTVLGAIQVGNTMGGVNWPGSGFDPETGIFYTQANNSSVGSGALRPEEFERIKPEAQTAMGRIPVWEDEHFGEPEIRGRRRRGGNPMTEGLEGLPIVKPPYGVVAAIDLNKGDLLWQVPHGDTPDEVRNNPLLQGMDIPKTGQRGIVGPLITKTLLIVGDPQVTSPPGRERGGMLRAYDKQTGEQVGAVWMPAAQTGNPMTYMVDGRQYIVVAVSGSGYSAAYISFALPEDMVEPTQSGANQ